MGFFDDVGRAFVSAGNTVGDGLKKGFNEVGEALNPCNAAGTNNPTSPTLAQLVGIPVGGTWEPNDQTCCPVTDGNNGSCVGKGFSWPNNGEFTWGGLGDTCTTVCPLCYGKSCNTGIVGKKPQVKRLNYGAPATQCCLTSHGTVDNNTCDPKYSSPAGSACATPLASTCTGSVLLNSQDPNYLACQSWCGANTAACNASKLSHCNSSTHVGDPQCLAFAKEWAGAGNSDFDVTSYNFCVNHPTDQFCSCIMAPSVYTGSNPELQVLNAPQCYDHTCMQEGYKTATQRKFICPTSICANTVNVKDLSASLVGSVEQSCATASAAGQYGAGTKSGGNPVGMVLLVIVLILLFGGGIYLLFDDESPDDPAGA